MDNRQIQYYYESIRYCDKLLSLLEKETDTIGNCFTGEPLQAYLSATDEAIRQTKMVKKALQSLLAMQQ